MIDLVMGLPGAGKGIYTVVKTIEELQSTERPIITNFAFELNPWVRRLGRRRSRGEKGMLGHLRDTYGETYNAENRIHVLEDEHIAEFYLWRVNHDGKLVKINADRDRDGTIVKIDQSEWANTVPCFYIVDEAWKFWNSRAWQKIDKGFQFYNAQHRKAGDDLLITVQAASQIDKQLRVLIQTFHHLVNHRHRKMLFFKQPNVISVIVTNEPPEAGKKSLGAVPKVIRFDPSGVGSCFDTAKGAGVQGQGADIEKKAKGLPWWGIIILFVGIGLAILLVSKYAGVGAGYLLTGGANTKIAKDTGKHLARVTTPQWSEPATKTQTLNTNVATWQHSKPDTNVLYVVGMTKMPVAEKSDDGVSLYYRPAHIIAHLSNGYNISSLDPRTTLITKDYVVWSGKTNYVREYYQTITQ